MIMSMVGRAAEALAAADEQVDDPDAGRRLADRGRLAAVRRNRDLVCECLQRRTSLSATTRSPSLNGTASRRTPWSRSTTPQSGSSKGTEIRTTQWISDSRRGKSIQGRAPCPATDEQRTVARTG